MLRGIRAILVTYCCAIAIFEQRIEAPPLQMSVHDRKLGLLYERDMLSEGTAADNVTASLAQGMCQGYPKIVQHPLPMRDEGDFHVTSPH